MISDFRLSQLVVSWPGKIEPSDALLCCISHITWNASWILQEGLFECIHCRNHNRPLFNSFPAPRLLCDKNDKVEDGLHSQADIPRSSRACKVEEWASQDDGASHCPAAEYSSGIRFIKEATRQRGKESERAGASRASQKANATCFPILFEIKMDITKTPNSDKLPFICRTYYEQNRAFDSEFLKSLQRCSWQRAHQRYISADFSSVTLPLMSWKSSPSVSQLKQSLETGRDKGVLFNF